MLSHTGTVYLYTYLNPFNVTDSEKLAALCASALEDEIAFQSANTISAFIMEPILGAGGVIGKDALRIVL